MNLYKSKVVKVLVSFVLSGFLMPSCTEDFMPDLGSMESVLVVDGAISDFPGPKYINLTMSVDYFYNESAPSVTGAKVTVFDGVDSVLFAELKGYPGYYKSPGNYIGVVGRTYKLIIENIDANGDGIAEVYEAESELKPVAPIDSFSMKYGKQYSYEFWSLILHAVEPAETEDFYVFKVYKNDTVISDQIQDWTITNDEFIVSGTSMNVEIYQLSEEDDDGIREFGAPNLGDVYILEMNGITEEYYDFLTAVVLEMSPKVPIFSGPSANVPTNVSNGARGFFAAYSVSLDTLVITQDILNQKNK
ncbi:MAG: DUF4249 domain-containing protein [Marinilabiliaceae bacterium]|nr:DUF4249 domain-containing protein [Marinilabiliaceae bacterium]